MRVLVAVGVAVAAVSLRYVRPRQVGYVGELAGDALDVSADHTTNCIPSSRGGCVPWYPAFVGVTAIAGVVVQPTSLLEVRAGVGGAVYVDRGSNVGAVVTQIDAAAFPFTHLRGVAGVRAIVLPRDRGDRLCMFPWMLGVRIR